MYRIKFVRKTTCISNGKRHNLLDILQNQTD